MLLEYRPSLVSFVDILGFGEMLSTKSAAGIEAYLKLLQRSTEPEKSKGADRQISSAKWFQVSDAVVRIRHFDTKYRDGALFSEIQDLGYAQARMAEMGAFIRGGLTIGDAIAANNGTGPAFGPAVAEAYKLESTAACYPRILISQTVIETFVSDERLRSDHNDPEFEIPIVMGSIANSSTGSFVDYLKIAKSLNHEEYHPRFCFQHAENLRECIFKYAENPRITEKYMWLAKYHNDHVLPLTVDETGEVSQGWIDKFGFDGITKYREAIIQPPPGLEFPARL